jgi:uncharacterized protein
MTYAKLTLSFLHDKFAICSLAQDARIPDWSLEGSFISITRTSEELSIVCPQANVPEQVKCEAGWRCLKVKGPLEFPLIGVLASLATPLASAGVSIFALSTFNTDYLLVKENFFETALQVLSQAGHKIES